MSFIDPPSGSVIANFEGTENATTITCNITNSEGNQISTQWFVCNFRSVNGRQFLTTENVTPELFHISGDPIPGNSQASYKNRLTVLTLDSDLDNVTVFCSDGIEQQHMAANFTLRIYRKHCAIGAWCAILKMSRLYYNSEVLINSM